MRKGLVIVLLALAGCQTKERQISRLWFFNYTKGESDTSLTPVCFIDLEKDGTYSLDFGDFEYGRWTYKSGLLTLTNQRNKTSSLKVRSLAQNEMQLVYNNKTRVFENQTGSSSGENPFLKENNLWRIPASKKESELELKNRLGNHVKFWELYFTWALENDIQSIDVRSMATPIKIYGNGFSIKSFDELPAKWKSFFYDNQDCLNANSMLSNVVMNEEIAWPHTDNKYKAFISVFQQLELKIKTSNFAHIFTPPAQ